VRSNSISRFFWLVVLVAITVSSAVYPKITYALVPSWNEASCVEQFVGEFQSVWAAKVYPGPPVYVLISGEKLGVYDIYRSDWTGVSWSPPVKVVTLSTDQFDLDVVIVGSKAYVIKNSGVTVCDWDEGSGMANPTASLCPVQSGTAGTGIIGNINHRDSYMYYSGGAAGAVKRFNMSVDPWTTAQVGPINWQSFGVYIGTDFAMVAVECDLAFGVPPYDCLNSSQFFIYEMPGWGSVATIPIQPDVKVASPFVAPDGKFWFVATPNVTPETRHLYSCAPDLDDGYCLGSADSFVDCCPAATCVGQGCAGYDCGCVPNCVGKECGDNGCGGTCGECVLPETCDGAGQCTCVPDCAGKECGDNGCGATCGTCDEFPNSVCDMGICSCTADTCGALGYECGNPSNGCGGTLNCGSCTNPPDECLPGGASRIYYDPPTCSIGWSCQYTSHEEVCAYGCADGVCLGCVPNCVDKECGDNGCGETCGTCVLPETCDMSGQCTETCAGICGDGVCCGMETCDDCPSDCSYAHPNVVLVSGCQYEYCGSNPAIHPITIRNDLGTTCHFHVDVLGNGVPAQIDLSGNGTCAQATLECLTSGCVLGCGDVDIVDNGQHITAVPSGEDVTTGIVGTNYAVQRYTDSGIDIFEAAVSAGYVWYTFPEVGTIHLAPAEDCPVDTTCQENVAINLTDDEVIVPDPPDGGETDGGEVDGGDAEIDAGETDGGDAEVIDGPDASDANDGIDGPDSPEKPDTDKPDGGTDTSDTDTTGPDGDKGGGGCQCSTSNSDTQGFPIAILFAVIGLLAMRKRAIRLPRKSL
jgi:hypothetical protein